MCVWLKISDSEKRLYFSLQKISITPERNWFVDLKWKQQHLLECLGALWWAHLQDGCWQNQISSFFHPCSTPGISALKPPFLQANPLWRLPELPPSPWRQPPVLCYLSTKALTNPSIHLCFAFCICILLFSSSPEVPGRVVLCAGDMSAGCVKIICVCEG